MFINVKWPLAVLMLAGLAASAPAGATSVVRPPDHRPFVVGPAPAQPVHWGRACHREMVRGRDAYGRRIMVPQRVCERVWVRGPR